MINTPPTFGVYILLEIFRWLEAQGGLAAMEKMQRRPRPSSLYDAIDNSNGFYKGTVSRQGAALAHERDLSPAQRRADG